MSELIFKVMHWNKAGMTYCASSISPLSILQQMISLHPQELKHNKYIFHFNITSTTAARKRKIGARGIFTPGRPLLSSFLVTKVEVLLKRKVI